MIKVPTTTRNCTQYACLVCTYDLFNLIVGPKLGPIWGPKLGTTRSQLSCHPVLWPLQLQLRDRGPFWAPQCWKREALPCRDHCTGKPLLKVTCKHQHEWKQEYNVRRKAHCPLLSAAWREGCHVSIQGCPLPLRPACVHFCARHGLSLWQGSLWLLRGPRLWAGQRRWFRSFFALLASCMPPAP